MGSDLHESYPSVKAGLKISVRTSQRTPRMYIRTRHALRVKRKIEMRSRNLCCEAKARLLLILGVCL